MSITKITVETLRTMESRDGIIIQGCGGDLNEWLEGINEVFTKEKILLDGHKIEECYTFENDGLTCLFFPLTDFVRIHKLVEWRIMTYKELRGTWLSDYVPKYLGGFKSTKEEKAKPDCPLIGQDGNIFNLMGIASSTLRKDGKRDEATEMCRRVQNCESYDEALTIIGEYVNITSVYD